MLVYYYSQFTRLSGKVKDFALLLLRALLAYGFYGPAKEKWSHLHGVGDWFRGLHIPFPYFNAYLSATTEITGVFLLLLGLGTRLISIPLIIVLLVAIKTVHWANGFNAGDNGYEIPLYYIIMLLVLISYGPGKLSVDYWLGSRRMKNEKVKR